MQTNKPIAPAVFLGIQQGFGDLPPLVLFNTTQAILFADGSAVGNGSTTTRRRLEEAGFSIDPVENAKASDALLNHMAQRRNLHQKEAA